MSALSPLLPLVHSEFDAQKRLIYTTYLFSQHIPEWMWVKMCQYTIILLLVLRCRKVNILL